METLDNSRILITGSGGMLGSYIDFGIKPNRETFDILDGDAVMAFVLKHRPTAIIHLASLTDTNACEEDKDHAFAVNGTGTLNIALASEAVGATMVYVSTSRVFSGDKMEPYTESEIPNPKSIYGKSKYLGEISVALVATKYLIVRGCWLFGGGSAHDTKFYGNVLKQLGNDTIRALDDVYGSPTYAKDFIKSILNLLEEGKQGVFHVSNSGSATRADIVEFMLTFTKSKSKLEKVTRSFYKNGHLLPSNEAITSKKIHLRPWKEALAEYIEKEWSIVT